MSEIHSHRADLDAKNRKTGLMVLAVVFVMVGLAFASVPLYDLFCRVTGFGGTTQTAQAAPSQSEILDRIITVQFNSDVNRNLPWVFAPEEQSMDINIGQEGLINYFAKNKSKKPVAGTAVYNVTPPKVGKYFHKTQCFCFNEQVLQPGERMNMPVLFFVDPAIADDPYMDDVKNITLSYTFFKTESAELEKALEEYYETN